MACMILPESLSRGAASFGDSISGGRLRYGAGLAVRLLREDEKLLSTLEPELGVDLGEFYNQHVRPVILIPKW